MRSSLSISRASSASRCSCARRSNSACLMASACLRVCACKRACCSPLISASRRAAASALIFWRSWSRHRISRPGWRAEVHSGAVQQSAVRQLYKPLTIWACTYGPRNDFSSTLSVLGSLLSHIRLRFVSDYDFIRKRSYSRERQKYISTWPSRPWILFLSDLHPDDEHSSINYHYSYV